MKKLIVAVMAAACAAEALAMPTKAELTKAQPLVTELMADDVAAFKAKSKKPEEIGDTSVAYAKEASTEAAKFLLLKGAISYYVRAEQYDKAADTVNELRSEIVDVPPAVIEEIIRKSTARVTAKKAPRLFAQYETAKVQMAAAKEVAAAKAALAKNPGDAALTRKLAEAQAASGDWKTALGTFAQLNSPAGETAKAESEGKNLSDVADFWWAYESHLGAEDGDAFKAHAAEIYRKCLADGSIEGLKRNIVEKRLKQIEVVPVSAVATGGRRSPGKLKDFAIDIGNGEKIEFVACPAGTFTMGYEDKPGAYQKHKVKISRPFWISKHLISVAQWQALMGRQDALAGWMKERSREHIYCPAKILGGNKTPACSTYDDYLEFMKRLSEVNKQELPSGYVFRYPSDAEWEYACKSGGKEKGPYGKMAWTGEEYAQVSMSFKNRRNLLREKGIKQVRLDAIGIDHWTIPALAIDYGTPNQWGIYGLIGCGQYTLDSVARVRKSFPENLIVDIKYPAGVSTDPLSVFATENQYNIVRGDPWLGQRHYKGNTASESLAKMNQYAGGVRPEVKLRVAIGPDLVGEWKAKHGGK